MLKRFALSIGCGLIMGLSWVEITNFYPLIFIALVPFLILEDEIYSNRLSSAEVYIHAFIIFAIFNLVSTWWIYHASPEGLAMAVIFGSMLVAFPFWFFHLTRKFIGNKEGYIAFVINILAFEWIDYRWPLSHPWLPFGNVFANSTDIIQWYEYTGVEGGTLWILVINLLIFFGYKKFKKGAQIKQLKLHIIGLLLLLIVPITISYVIKSNIDLGENNPTVSIVVSQPNIDPYQKFGGGATGEDQVKNMLNVTLNSISKETELIVTPETAIPFSLDENGIYYSNEVQLTQVFLRSFPKTKILTGASTHAYFEKKNSDASRKLKSGEGYYESYNSSLLIDSSDDVMIYHKNKLVLGVETLPFKFITKPLESLFDLGGTSGSLGVSKEPKIFSVGNARIAPTICYESIYGEYTSEFCKKGANVIAIITNDAWWYDTPGYKQLLAYGKLRAIENRKWIARSANTGISCFINPAGKIEKRTNWEEATSISMDVPLNERVTFYAQYGDFISRISVFIAAFLLLLTFVRKFKKKLV